MYVLYINQFLILFFVDLPNPPLEVYCSKLGQLGPILIDILSYLILRVEYCMCMAT